MERLSGRATKIAATVTAREVDQTGRWRTGRHAGRFGLGQTEN